MSKVTHRWSGPYHDRLEYLLDGRVLTMEEIKGYINHALSVRPEAGVTVAKSFARRVERHLAAYGQAELDRRALVDMIVAAESKPQRKEP